MTRVFFVGVLLVLGVAACRSIPNSGAVHVNADTSGGAKDSNTWWQMVEEHSRRSEPYEWAMRQADLRATLITPRLRHAFLQHRESFHGEFAKELERELVAMGNADEGTDASLKAHADSEEQVVVFVAMFVADQKNRDIAASYTIWNTELVRGNSHVKPLSFETVRLSPAVKEVFPYVDRFDDLYLVRFPRQDPAGVPLVSPGPEPLQLLVQSQLAHANVSWTIAE